MKLFPLFAVALLILPAVSAYTFLNIYLEENGEAVFLGETDAFPELPEGVSLENGIILGNTQELTTKEGVLWTFSYQLESADLHILLPKGAVLKSLSGGEVSLERGQLSLYTQEAISFSYMIEAQEGRPGIFLVVALLLGVLVALIAIFYWRRKTGKKQAPAQPSAPLMQQQKNPDPFTILHHVLSEREKLILSTLRKTGKIKSSYLRKLTQLPKASFSRHLYHLEKKGLMKKTGEGRNKFVEIAGKFQNEGKKEG